MIVTHNMNSLRATNRLTSKESSRSESMRKISSGLKINEAGDDPAGMAITASLKGKIRSLSRAQLSVQEGINLTSLMGNSLDLLVDGDLNRLRELALQGASDTAHELDRNAAQGEIEQILNGINDIALGTEYNGRKLLCPPVETLSMQIGTELSDTLKIHTFDVRTNNIGLDNISVRSDESSLHALSKIDKAIELISGYVTEVGSYEEALVHSVKSLSDYEMKLTQSQSQIEDVDIAKESLELAKNNIVTEATQAILSQANHSTDSVIQLLK